MSGITACGWREDARQHGPLRLRPEGRQRRVRLGPTLGEENMTDQIEARPKRAATSTSTAAAGGDAPAKANVGATVKGSAKAVPVKAAARPRRVATAPSATARRPVAVPVVHDSYPTGAGSLTIQQGGIGALTATDVAVTQGGVGALRAERLSVELGGVGAALANDLDVRQGFVGAAIARDARFEQAGVRTLIANRVHFGPNSGAGVVLAAHVEGDVRTLVDWRGALAFGAAAGVVMAIFRGRRR
jgi:hypothetical protein